VAQPVFDPQNSFFCRINNAFHVLAAF
jgi:hypothetical protein